ICPGETVTLDATTPNATYEWQDGSTDAVFEDAGPGSYWVKVTIFDCTKTDYINVIEQPGPPDLGDDLSLCEGETQILDVTTPWATYQWQDNSTQPMYTVTQAGDYAVTVTIDDCEFTDNLQAEYIEIPEIELGNDTLLCEGFEVLLDATYPGASYEWQDQSTSSTFTVTAPGEYTVTVNVSGCIGEDVIEVAYTYLDPIDLGPDETLCNGENLYVDAFRPGATYLWQDNSTLSGYDISESGTYWVMIEEDNCFISDTIEVVVVPGITLELGNDTTLCHGQSITLDVTQPGATYTWQDQSTGSSFEVTAPGEYSVIIEIGDCTASDVIHVSYVDAINIQLGPDTTLCTNETLLLEANIPGANIEWQDQSTGSTFSVIQAGQYWVNVSLNGCVDSDTIQISYLSLSSFDLGEDITLCDGETILLDATQPGTSYLWQDDSTSPTYLVTTEGSYQVTVSLGNCYISDTIEVDYNHQVPITLGNDTTLCQGETLLLEAVEPGSVLEWQDQSTSSTFLVNSPGMYWVKAYAGDCSFSDTIDVSYVSLASIHLGDDTTLCSGQQLVLEAGIPGAAYLWQDNSTNDSIQINQPGQYWVQVSSQGCEVADTIQIDFQTLSAISLGNDTLLCDGETLVLAAGNTNASYTWQDQTSDSIFIVSQPGIYWVIASIGSCQVSDSIEVSYQNLPFVELGNDTTLCAGEQLTLHASYPGATYEWQDQTTLPDLLVTEAGEYIVHVRSNFCEATDTIHVTYLELSSIDLGPDTTLCDGQMHTLQVNAPGAEYVWQDQSNLQTYVVTQPGMYWVEVSLANCATADTIHVDFAQPVSVDLGTDTTLCPGAELILNAQATGATYEWQDLSGQPTYTVNQSGTYYVSLNIAGCMAADTLEVDYMVLPAISLGPDTSLCDGASIQLDVTNPGAQYEWQDHSTEPTFLANQAGTFYVTLTLGQCTISDSITIQYETPLVVELGTDKTICDGESIQLSPDLQQKVDYLWQDHSTNSSFEVSEAGLYWVQVSDECGMASDSVRVTIEDCDCQVYTSNVFSPNGDGVNDRFNPQSSCPFITYQLTVFDRFGGLAFETFVPGQGWDGVVKSKEAQVGVYVFLLTYAFENGETQRMHGDITLLR
ncbi:MAG TPA: gliding motility-associated C-terminal domain-containing protein, partial [Saprospiraceae bacterium]